VIYDNPFAQNPIEVYSRREDLAEIVRERLSKAVSRWGVDITSLVFEGVDISMDVRRAINKANIRLDSIEQKKSDAEAEAAWIERTREAQAKADAQRVVEIVRALKADGMELTHDEIRDIVIDAMRVANEYNMDTAFMRPLLEGPAKPPAEKKDNSAKK
jgi:regulator of protease activity HflC (stomatin/prohibitin superfamily)